MACSDGVVVSVDLDELEAAHHRVSALRMGRPSAMACSSMTNTRGSSACRRRRPARPLGEETGVTLQQEVDRGREQWMTGCEQLGWRCARLPDELRVECDPLTSG